MAAAHKKKKRRSVADRPGRTNNSNPKTKWWVVALLGIAIVAFIYSSIPRSAAPSGPRFTKEGELNITRDGATIAELDIEIADNRDDITQGLMYRAEMDWDRGMLFLMEASEIQSFWMLNTLIPLDIIFVGEDRRIINIAANTPPKSIESVSSTAPARYVLEVNGGYAAEKGLRAGDELQWSRQ